MSEVKISVIVAVYGVEQYIAKCAHSLFAQTLQDVEFIFVNDCTKDNSMSVLRAVLNEYPVRKALTKIIDLTENGGVANARTIGMKLAKGEYMIHCDPDDYVDEDYLETLFRNARQTNADIVVCDYYREVHSKSEYVTQNYGITPNECIQYFYKSPFFPTLCATLVRSSIIHENQIYPYQNINTGEDLNVIFRTFLKAKTLSYINRAFYHYVQREVSLTQNKDILESWNKNISKNLLKITQLLDAKDKEDGGNNYILTKHYLQYTKKLKLLQYKPPYWKLWYKEYPNCINSIAFFSGFSSKHKFVMKLFGRYYVLLAIYYKLFYPLGIRVM